MSLLIGGGFMGSFLRRYKTNKYIIKVKHATTKRSLFSASDLIVTMTAIASSLLLLPGLGHAEGQFTVSGTFTVNSTPIPNAQIIISTANGGQQAFTDNNGHYSIGSIPSGSYPVRISYSPPNPPVTQTAPYIFNVNSASAYVTVGSSDVTRDLSFDTNNQAVVAHVQDTNGSPVEGASVTMNGGGEGVESSDFLFSDGTDGQGFYAYRIYGNNTTDASGNANMPVFSGINYNACVNANDYSHSYCQTVTGSSGSPINITIPAKATVSGTFTVNSTPIPNAQIIISTPAGGHQALTDSNGHYSIDSISPGSYPIRIAYSPPNPPVTQTVPYIFNVNAASAYVTVNGNDVTRDLSFNTNAHPVIAHVQDTHGNPVSGASVTMNGGGSGQESSDFLFSDGTDGQGFYAYNLYGNNSTDANGNANIPVFPGMSYNICVSYYIFSCQSATPQENIPVNITINLGTLSGTLSVNSKPVSGAKISLPNIPLSAVTDANGHYSIEAVPPGNWVVSVYYTPPTTPVVNALPYILDLKSESAYVNVSGDTVQNLSFDTNAIPIVGHVQDTNGNPISGVSVTLGGGVAVQASNNYSIFDGTDGHNYAANQIFGKADTDLTGDATIPVFAGINYNACATYFSSYCQLVPQGSRSFTITIPIQLPSAPNNLHSISPTQNPVLNWDTSSGATSYDIYRNGVKINSTSSTSFTDNSSSEGTSTYYVTATNTEGESNSSNSVNVLVDRTQPSINYSLSPAKNTSGWNNNNVTVSFTCSDSGSGIATCPGSTTLTDEGGGQIITGTATDNAGNSASASAIVNIDKTAPVISNVGWTSNPLLSGQNTTLSATVSDGLSGVGSVHYSINGGTAQTMTFDSTSGTWKGSFGSSLAVGTYNVMVTATDLADNTSSGTPDVLAVYTTSNGYVTGHAKLTPSSTDTMPIALDTSNNPAKLVLGFTNVTAPASGSFDIDYSINNNKDEFELASTGITWIVIPDSSHASVLGTATKTVYVNGVKTVTNSVPVRFDVTLGIGGAADQITIKVFNPGDNPSTATPAYLISDLDSNGSNLRIHP